MQLPCNAFYVSPNRRMFYSKAEIRTCIRAIGYCFLSMCWERHMRSDDRMGKPHALRSSEIRKSENHMSDRPQAYSLTRNLLPASASRMPYCYRCAG